NLFLGRGSGLRRSGCGGLAADIPGVLPRMDTGPAGIAPFRRAIVDVDRIETLEHLYDAIVLASICLDDQHRLPTVQTFRIQVRISIRQGMTFDRCPVVEIAAVVQELHLGIVDSRSDQGLSRAPG